MSQIVTISVPRVTPGSAPGYFLMTLKLQRSRFLKMPKLVLIVYLALVLAVAGVAADSRKQPPVQSDKRQVQDPPGRDASEPHPATEQVAHERVEYHDKEDGAHLADAGPGEP